MLQPSDAILKYCKGLCIDGSRSYISDGPEHITAIAGLAMVSDFAYMRHGADLFLFEQRLLRAHHQEQGIAANDMFWSEVLDFVKLEALLPLQRFRAGSHGQRFAIHFEAGPVLRQTLLDSAAVWSGRAQQLT